MQRLTAGRAARFLAAHTLFLCLLGALFAAPACAGADTTPVDEDGYQLWLRYRPLPAPLRAPLAKATLVSLAPATPTVQAATAELRRGLEGLSGHTPRS